MQAILVNYLLLVHLKVSKCFETPALQLCSDVQYYQYIGYCNIANCQYCDNDEKLLISIYYHMCTYIQHYG